jgi:hypothetical protein
VSAIAHCQARRWPWCAHVGRSKSRNYKHMPPPPCSKMQYLYAVSIHIT